MKSGITIPNNGLVVSDFSAVDDGGTSRLDKLDELNKLGLHVIIGKHPEGVPRKTKDGTLESTLVSEVLRVSTLGGLATLRKSVVIALVNTIDSIKNSNSILDVAGKGTNRILVLTLGNDTSTRGQANSGLEANNGVAVGRVND